VVGVHCSLFGGCIGGRGCIGFFGVVFGWWVWGLWVLVVGTFWGVLGGFVLCVFCFWGGWTGGGLVFVGFVVF